MRGKKRNRTAEFVDFVTGAIGADESHNGEDKWDEKEEEPETEELDAHGENPQGREITPSAARVFGRGADGCSEADMRPALKTGIFSP